MVYVYEFEDAISARILLSLCGNIPDIPKTGGSAKNPISMNTTPRKRGMMVTR